jgi:hypothetical protein
MLKTIVLLIAALVAVPLATFYFDAPLSDAHWAILQNSLLIYLGVALGCFALAEITRNCSQVDKIWSIVPIAYVWYIAVAGGLGDRAILMAVLVTLWGARLTYNFSRRGAYTWKFWTGEEDYRWEVLRKMPLAPRPHAVVFLQPVLHFALPKRSDSALHLAHSSGLGWRRKGFVLGRLLACRLVYRRLGDGNGGRSAAMGLPKRKAPPQKGWRKTHGRIFPGICLPWPLEMDAPPQLHRRTSHLGHFLLFLGGRYWPLVQLVSGWGHSFVAPLSRKF